MNATIKDIAQECGVSTATVSLALSGKKGRVSAETTARILSAAARLQYTPNRAAISLATRHTKLVGVLMTGMGFDGARAMAELKARGGRTIAEAESSCVVFGMPSELIQRGGASVVLPSQDVARQLRTWVQRLG